MSSKARSEGALCAALFALAAVVRVLFLLGTVDRDLPFSIFYYGDSRIYREFALALLRGDVFERGIPLHPPAFAFVLSWVIRSVGERPTALRAVLAIAGAAMVPMTYLLGRMIWNRTVGVIAALLATYSFGLCVLSVSANVETIYIPLLCAEALLLILLGGALASPGRRSALTLTIALGVVLGISTLTRAEHLGHVALFPAALAIGWPSIPWRRVALSTAGITVIGLVAIVPWSIHNHDALARFNAANPGLVEPLPTWVGVSGAGPLNFALANNGRTDGGFHVDAVVAEMGQGQIDLRDPEQADLYLHGLRRGFAFLVGEPSAAASLLARKMALASDAFSLGFGLSNWPGGLVGKRRPVDVFTPNRAIWKPIALILLVYGVWVSRPVLRRAGMLWMTTLFVVAVTLATFGYARFFLCVAPFVFLFQAVALVEVVSRLRTFARRRAVALLGAVLALALTIELAVAVSQPRNFRASGSTDPATGKLIQDAPLALEPAR